MDDMVQDDTQQDYSQPDVQSDVPAGGLSQVQDVQPDVQPDIQPTQETAQPKTSPTTEYAQQSVLDYRKGQILLNQQIQKLQDALNQRINAPQAQNQLFDPVLMKFAAGMLAPTKTGGFGESLGYAMSGASQAQDEQLKQAQAKRQQDLQDLEAQFNLTKTQNEMLKQNAIQDLGTQLYQKKTDLLGNTTYGINPDVAFNMASISGDPKMLQMAIEQQKAENKRKAEQDMFVKNVDPQTSKTTYSVNPDAVMHIMQTSDTPAQDIKAFTDNITGLRKAGVLTGANTEATPFDAIGLMSQDPLIKAQAQRYAEQYKNGMIEEDKANSLAQNMISLETQHMDRVTAEHFKETMGNLMYNLHKDAQDRNKVDDDTRLAMATKIAHYEMPGFTGFALRSPENQKTMAMVDSIRTQEGLQPYDATQYNAKNKVVTAFADPQYKPGAAILANNTAIDHLATLRDLSTAMKNHDVQALNAIYNNISTQFGGDAPTNFEAAVKIVAPEVAKAAAGAGAGSDRERKSLEESLSTAKSPQQLEGAINQYTRLLKGKMDNLRLSYENGTGLKDFDKFYSERAKVALGVTKPSETKTASTPTVNSKGWVLHTDKNGNKAYVNPANKNEYEEVK